MKFQEIRSGRVKAEGKVIDLKNPADADKSSTGTKAAQEK